MKAADIPDKTIYALVRQAQYPRIGQNRWAIRDALPQFPDKVILAKLRQMVTSGRLYGCACGCRGDFTIPSGKDHQ